MTRQNFDTDHRLDPNKQRQVIELAARLQEQNRDHVSPAELEDLAAEAGLDREYVRKALDQLQPKAVAPKPTARRPMRWPAPTGIWPEITTALIITLWATICQEMPYHRHMPSLLWLVTVGGLGLLIVTGLTARNRGLALVYGIVIASYVLTTIGHSFTANGQVALMAAAVLLAMAAYSIRSWFIHFRKPQEELSPAPVPSPSDRLERLEQLRSLRLELEAEKASRAFLSVDVVKSTDIKASLGDLEAERVFGLYQRWIAGVVSNFGGEVGSSAGDGAMAVFPNGLSALRCAKALQQGLTAFNIQNGTSLAVRCGISVGGVAWSPGTRLTDIHSPVVDRAAVRQKLGSPGAIVIGEELVADAAYELGGVSPLVNSGDDRAFEAFAH